MSVINTIEYNQKQAAELDKKLTQGAVTGFMEDPTLRAKFVGAKTVLVPELEMTGMGDYDRKNGFAKGAVDITNTPFTLQQDRGTTFTIDDQDMDESGAAVTMANAMATFVEDHVVPEVDAYVLSKIAGMANEAAQTITGTPATEAYKMLVEAIAKVQNKVGYNKELVAFVDGTFYAALNSTPEISRHLVTGEFKHGEMNTMVKKLNGVAILPVPDDRMKTAYTFYPGDVNGESAGGFEPTGAAKSIGLIVMPKKAASLIKKTAKTRIFTPAQNQTADAWKGDYRIYYDVVVKNSQKKGIYVYTY